MLLCIAPWATYAQTGTWTRWSPCNARRCRSLGFRTRRCVATSGRGDDIVMIRAAKEKKVQLMQVIAIVTGY